MSGGELNPYDHDEPLWLVWRAENGLGHYPTPADQPHAPASAQGQAWTRALLRWQMSARNPWLRFRQAEVDAERHRIEQSLMPSPAELATAATLHEVAAATAPPARHRVAVVSYRHGQVTTTVYDLDELWARWTEAMQPLVKTLEAIATATATAFEQVAAIFDQYTVAASRHAGGRARPRPPHASEGVCHHRNPRNACRDCSTQRGPRLPHERNDTRGGRPDARRAAPAVRGARSTLPRPDRRRQR